MREKVSSHKFISINLFFFMTFTQVWKITKNLCLKSVKFTQSYIQIELVLTQHSQRSALSCEYKWPALLRENSDSSSMRFSLFAMYANHSYFAFSFWFDTLFLLSSNFQLYNFFNALLTHIPDSANKPTGSSNTSRSSSNGTFSPS